MVDKKEKHPEETKKNKKELELEEKIKTLEGELTTWKNKYYMVYADMENARKQNEKTLSEALKYRAAGFIENIFPLLDSFQFALDMKTDDETLKRFLIGFEHIYRQLKTVLENEGVKDISPDVGAKFDYKTMHALDTEFSDLEENIVLRVVGRGYQLKDRLIRPSMVILSKKKPVEAPPEPQPVKEADKHNENADSAKEFDA